MGFNIRRDLTVDQGTNFEYTFVARHANGSVIDLSNYASARGTIRSEPGWAK